MMTVNEVSKITGVSIRTLHYYDQIGLLHATQVTKTGYRLYDDTALDRLQQILLFRELEFPLKEIIKILESEDFDRNKALEQQIKLLTLKKERLERLITFAREIKLTGVKNMDFTAFDTSKIDEYTKKAKENWGNTKAYKEFEEKGKNRSPEAFQEISKNMMNIFAVFGSMMHLEASDIKVQNQVKNLQEYITKHFYTCTPEILQGLGKMYVADSEFTKNIDAAGGKGCAQFVCDAIEVYVSKNK